MNAAPAELEAYLHEHIPLSRAMQVSVVEAGVDGVLLRAPLAPNINHRETVFGGSASAVAILAAWSLLHLRLRAEGLASRLVIQRNSMEYLHAITSDFSARASSATGSEWQRFVEALRRKGRARTCASARLFVDDDVAARLSGEFVAIDVDKR